MITIKYNGGMGNQMFQYALGQSLAQEIGVDVFYDYSFFNQKCSKSRPYRLNVFNINKKPSSDLRVGLYWNTRRLFKVKNFLGLEIYHEKDFMYDENIFKIGQDAFIEGFFQSEKYFKNIEQKIREDFAFKNKPTGKNLEIIEMMNDTNSVSMHVRRGDYVNKKRYETLFHHCDLDYYNNAISLFEDAMFFVFSDDPAWAQETFKAKNIVIVSHNNGENDFEDMRLMKSAKHNIIANSSFSWWGAYLNPNPQKTVICPKKWFCEIQTPDIYPDFWNKM